MAGEDSMVAQRDLRRVRAAAARVEKAERELRDAIRAAVASGESYRDIAPFAGLSYSRVYQLAQEHEPEDPPHGA